jgi:hypothetical protein
MAKKKEPNYQIEKIWVESRTYGGHWRARRGSKNPAKVNDAMLKSSQELQLANKAARLIKLHIDPFRSDFMGGQLWQHLVKKFKQQIKAGQEFNTQNLKELEVWATYPQSRFGAVFTPEIKVSSSSIYVTLKRVHHPNFKRSFTDSYQLSMLAIFPDFEKMEAEDEVSAAKVFFMKDKVEDVSFGFTVPAGAAHYLLVLKVEGTENGEPNDNVTIKSMSIVDAGTIH